MAMIAQLVELTAPLWAVFAGKSGEPEVLRVVSLARFEGEANGQPVSVVGGLVPSDKLRAADAMENFVGYSDQCDAAWIEERYGAACLAKRQQLEEAAAIKGKTKIIVPDKPQIQFPN